jgi:hypothetical protein
MGWATFWAIFLTNTSSQLGFLAKNSFFALFPFENCIVRLDHLSITQTGTCTCSNNVIKFATARCLLQW